ncbi:MAG TPA: MFS transporter [Gemmatimonadales bacterium]|nr:MFS transporter [Gemmatimonadales bacterium]
MPDNQARPDEAVSHTSSLKIRLTWIAALAFASGFPFGLVNETVPIYLRTHGASLVEIGQLAKLSLPWSLKWLWAPLVDRHGSRRHWISACLAGIAVLTLAAGTLDVVTLGAEFWIILFAMVFLSATQDVAIDAYTIQSTTTRELGVANSVRITLYRVGMLTAGGLLVWLAGRIGWSQSFSVGAGLLGVLALCALFLPAVERTAGRPESLWEPLRELFRRPSIGTVVLFALIFKLDIAALEPMMRPFWVDAGLTLEEIGAVVTSGRLVATIAGAALGGVFTTRYGIFTGLWVLGLVQALSGLVYWGTAVADSGTGLVVAAAYFESFAAGLGTSAYLAFLMSVCEKRYAATQFAVLSALLALTRWIAGDVSGELAEWLGYSNYFLLTFFLGLPAFALIPRLRQASRR